MIDIETTSEELDLIMKSLERMHDDSDLDIREHQLIDELLCKLEECI